MACCGHTYTVTEEIILEQARHLTSSWIKRHNSSMNQLSKHLLVIFVIGIIFTLLSSSASAYHRHVVLGDSTQTKPLNEITLPATTEGPGLILPDSPLYFLDAIKQQVRASLAVTPEAKAKLHAQIAGERMAELRLMLYRNNEKGFSKALDGLTYHFTESEKSLEEAKMSGTDVSELAKQINDSIKAKQQALDTLEQEGKSTVQVDVVKAQDLLMETKVKVEDGLNEADLANEIADDLRRITKRRVLEAESAVSEIDVELAILEKQASEAAKQTLTRREKALQEAIVAKNNAARNEQERQITSAQKRSDEAYRVQKEAADQARIAIEQAKEAALKFQQAQKRLDAINAGEELSSTPSEPKPTPRVSTRTTVSPVAGAAAQTKPNE